MQVIKAGLAFALAEFWLAGALSNKLFARRKKKQPALLSHLAGKRSNLMNSSQQTTARILPENITHAVRNVECCLLLEATNTVLELVKVHPLPSRWGVGSRDALPEQVPLQFISDGTV